jgi:hypothetical protein
MAAEKENTMRRLIKLALIGLGICTLPFLLSACGRGWKNVKQPNSFGKELFAPVEGDPDARGRLPVWGWKTIILVRNTTPFHVYPAFRNGVGVRYYGRRTVPPGKMAAFRVGPHRAWFGWVRQDGTPADSPPEVVDRLHLF